MRSLTTDNFKECIIQTAAQTELAGFTIKQIASFLYSSNYENANKLSLALRRAENEKTRTRTITKKTVQNFVDFFAAVYQVEFQFVQSANSSNILNLQIMEAIRNNANHRREDISRGFFNKTTICYSLIFQSGNQASIIDTDLTMKRYDNNVQFTIGEEFQCQNPDQSNNRKLPIMTGDCFFDGYGLTLIGLNKNEPLLPAISLYFPKFDFSQLHIRGIALGSVLFKSTNWVGSARKCVAVLRDNVEVTHNVSHAFHNADNYWASVDSQTLLLKGWLTTDNNITET